MWANTQLTHALTLSLGVHPRRFDLEEEFFPILRNLVRETSQKMRKVPKRQLLGLRPEDPRTVFLAGFYEEGDRKGVLNPHWHGGVALRPGEERCFRALLRHYWGKEAKKRERQLHGPQEPLHPLVKIPNAKPTFDLTELTTSKTYISYSTKSARFNEPEHCTTYDFLAQP